jgi:acyl-coenzyme A synthetase/AMP-(fatty) acid ligase/acyl carrier protein
VVENALEGAAAQAAEQVSLVNTVPSAMAELVKLDLVGQSVRTVNLAGEPLQRRLVDEIYERGRVRRVINLYGPTEDTTYSTIEEVERGVSERPSVGRPIANTEAYVLDEWMEASGVGIKGELYIGGAGLARGYWERPELSAERFLPDPFSGRVGGRLYRTGDVVKRLTDGRIDYLGRADQQVKLHGYRIELGEIEKTLQKHKAIEDAVVVVRQQESGEQRLIGYVVCHETAPAPKLRAFLKQYLPSYMIPSAFVFMESLPLTQNGKVDRQSLPHYRESDLKVERPYAPPRSQTERMLASLWESSLGLERISINDDFFEIGGDSIIAVQLVSKIRAAFQLDLGMQLLFESPTIAGVSDAIERMRTASNGLQAIGLKRYSREIYRR